jgi:bifunctional non-homologous end joining protein LigD
VAGAAAASFVLWREGQAPGRRGRPGFRLMLQLPQSDHADRPIHFELDWSFATLAPGAAHHARLLPGEAALPGSPFTRWDEGALRLHGDPEDGLRRGKLLLVFDGQRLSGTWSLGREKGRFLGRGRGEVPSESWRLARKPETAAAPETRAPLRLTNLSKPYWPEAEGGYTKGHLLGYYRAVAPWLLPYLRDRPVVLTRYPDGIHGRSFFQHHAPGARSAWLRTVRIEMSRRPRDYLLCDDVESLLYLVNLGSIVLHLWPSRSGAVSRPDYCILDLDPHGTGFAGVIEVARRFRALCQELGLPSYVKTSGGSGLHVLLPLAGQLDFAGSRTLCELLTRTLEAETPEQVGLALGPSRPVNLPGTSAPVRSPGRVLVDSLVNSQGRLLVAPLSVRPLPGAPVSMPLAWEELAPDLDPRTFTLATVPGLLEAAAASGREPWQGFEAAAPDLAQALERLRLRGRRAVR